MKATTLDEALGLLDYFNGFHDGFINKGLQRTRDQRAFYLSRFVRAADAGR